ncbi:hypothetical protein IAT38_003674 [Cryptococcus sp. DSM 104549]
MSTISTGGAGVLPEGADEDPMPADTKRPGVVNVNDLPYMLEQHLQPPSAANGHSSANGNGTATSSPAIATPSLSPPFLTTTSTPDSDVEPIPLSPPAHPVKHIHHPSPLASSADAKGLVAGHVSLNDGVHHLSPIPSSSAPNSAVMTDGSNVSPRLNGEGGGRVPELAFPFPNAGVAQFRPLPSSTNSPAHPPQMTIPPPVSGNNSAIMSRNGSFASTQEPSGASVNRRPSDKHHEAAAAAATGGRSSRSGSTSKPGSEAAQKKSFFHKMFHPNESKHGDKLGLEIPRHAAPTRATPSGTAGWEASGQVSPRGTSPAPPSRDATTSPPLTPQTPPANMSDSDVSRPPSRAPSRAASFRRQNSGGPAAGGDPHAAPPLDRRGAATPPVPAPAPVRRSSQRSAGSPSRKPATVTLNGQPAIVAKKEEVVASSGAKFTLKDLVGLGEGKGRKASAAGGSAKGSDRGSTRGSEAGGGDGGSTASLLKKYGVCDRAAIGKGATAVVRLAHKWDRREEKLYAVKEFRKRRKNETEKEYVKKLTSEFCISSTLHHMNVVETVDLVQDEAHHWCEVMEYCPGGDLYAAIKKGGMSSGEVECTFKQVMQGIAYLHSMGVAHRDIKPENLLLDGRGHVKITDFGVSDVFRMCWEKKTHMSKGLCGSEPYIAPELFDHKEYDARLVDVWAAAIVFYCMQFQELPWRVAKTSDSTFATYLSAYRPVGTAPTNPDGTPARHPTPPPLDNLIPRECRNVIKHMLDPDPKTRWGVEEALRDKWLAGVEVCVEGKVNGHKHTTAGMEIVKA